MIHESWPDTMSTVLVLQSLRSKHYVSKLSYYRYNVIGIISQAFRYIGQNSLSSFMNYDDECRQEKS